MLKSVWHLLIVIIPLLLWPLNGFADSPGALVAKGNRAYNAGKYDEALSAYDKAVASAPESPYAYFNKGAALYKKGDYGAAAKAYEKAALKSRDVKLEAKSKFNLGNCAFREAEGQKNGDLNKALKACGKSIQYYQEALKLDPDDKAAAENIELARMVMKNILDEINKQKKETQKQAPKTNPQEASKKTQNAPGTHSKNQDDQGSQPQKAQPQPKAQTRPEKEQNPGEPQNQGEPPSALPANPGKNQDQQKAQALQALAPDDARDILKEEKENQQKRRLLGLGGHMEVDKDW